VKSAENCSLKHGPLGQQCTNPGKQKNETDFHIQNTELLGLNLVTRSAHCLIMNHSRNVKGCLTSSSLQQIRV
jgi:hypothetical protein